VRVTPTTVAVPLACELIALEVLLTVTVTVSEPVNVGIVTVPLGGVPCGLVGTKVRLASLNVIVGFVPNPEPLNETGTTWPAGHEAGTTEVMTTGGTSAIVKVPQMFKFAVRQAFTVAGCVA
jgi:hypothetical protein